MFISTQRPAIEKLAPRLQPLTLRPGLRFFLDGEEVYFSGVSMGFTRYARLYGMPFAGFSSEPGDASPLPSREAFDCAGAVLLRATAIGERSVCGNLCLAPNDMRSIVAIEALRWAPLHVDRVVFRRSGHRSFYVDLL